VVQGARLDLPARPHNRRVARDQGIRMPSIHRRIRQGPSPEAGEDAVNGVANPARSLYVDLIAQGLDVRLREDAWGEGVLDYGVVVDGLRSLSAAQMGSLAQRIRANENDLVHLLASTGDLDILAILEEFECG
jgi:hypothetical protein